MWTVRLRENGVGSARQLYWTAEEYRARIDLGASEDCRRIFRQVAVELREECLLFGESETVED